MLRITYVVSATFQCPLTDGKDAIVPCAVECAAQIFGPQRWLGGRGDRSSSLFLPSSVEAGGDSADLEPWREKNWQETHRISLGEGLFSVEVLNR